MHLYKYSLSDLEQMIPWERDIYVELLREHIENENLRMMNKQNEARSLRRGR